MHYGLSDVDPLFLIYLAGFVLLCNEGIFWLKEAVGFRQYLVPLAFFAAAFYVLMLGVRIVLNV